MQLIASLTADDVEENAPAFDYENFAPRIAVRAIVFDGEKVALLRVSAHNYFMLPGGGVDNDEGLEIALLRELQEELGCVVRIQAEVGAIEVFNDRWRKKQTDYCFVVEKLGSKKDIEPTQFETDEGHQVEWVESISSAVELLTSSNPVNRDGKLVVRRDLLFLQAWQETTTKIKSKLH